MVRWRWADMAYKTARYSVLHSGMTGPIRFPPNRPLASIWPNEPEEAVALDPDHRSGELRHIGLPPSGHTSFHFVCYITGWTVRRDRSLRVSATRRLFLRD